MGMIEVGGQEVAAGDRQIREVLSDLAVITPRLGHDAASFVREQNSESRDGFQRTFGRPCWCC